jgi:CHAD domain-containing protein
MHEVRKRAKHVRYAADVVDVVLGDEARGLAKAAKKVQHALGAHHDAVVAMEHVLDLADAARDEGRDTFTFGVLLARLEDEVSEQDRSFRRTWKKLI